MSDVIVTSVFETVAFFCHGNKNGIQDNVSDNRAIFHRTGSISSNKSV